MEKTDLDALVVQLQTVRYSFSKDLADLRPVPTFLSIAFHPSLLVHNATLDDTVSDGFTDNILCIFLGIQMELETNISERYP